MSLIDQTNQARAHTQLCYPFACKSGIIWLLLRAGLTRCTPHYQRWPPEPPLKWPSWLIAQSGQSIDVWVYRQQLAEQPSSSYTPLLMVTGARYTPGKSCCMDWEFKHTERVQEKVVESFDLSWLNDVDLQKQSNVKWRRFWPRLSLTDAWLKPRPIMSILTMPVVPIHQFPPVFMSFNRLLERILTLE